jgi:hypothetical protein
MRNVVGIKLKGINRIIIEFQWRSPQFQFYQLRMSARYFCDVTDWDIYTDSFEKAALTQCWPGSWRGNLHVTLRWQRRALNKFIIRDHLWNFINSYQSDLVQLRITDMKGPRTSMKYSVKRTSHDLNPGHLPRIRRKCCCSRDHNARLEPSREHLVLSLSGFMRLEGHLVSLMRTSNSIHDATMGWTCSLDRRGTNVYSRQSDMWLPTFRYTSSLLHVPDKLWYHILDYI